MSQTLQELLDAKYDRQVTLSELIFSVDSLCAYHRISLDTLQDIVALLTWRGKQ